MKRIYVVRHGMRLDHENRSWKNTAARPFDSPLSETGFEQAYKTGVYLSQFDITKIIASPLLRTIQTATEITKSIDLNFQVEGGIAEWHNPKWYDYSPGMLPLNDLIDEYPRIDLAYQPLVRPTYPEKHEQICRDRCTYVARHLSATTTGDILLITHGICVLSICEGLTGSKDNIKGNTCAVNVLEEKGDGWRLAFTSTDHLTKQEKTVEFI